MLEVLSKKKAGFNLNLISPDYMPDGIYLNYSDVFFKIDGGKGSPTVQSATHKFGWVPTAQIYVLNDNMPFTEANGNALLGGVGHRLVLDTSKRYRFSVWIQNTFSKGYPTTTKAHLGVKNKSGGTLLNAANGVVNSDPKFLVADLDVTMERNVWFLMVGYIEPFGSSNKTVAESALYTANGVKVSGATALDFRFGQSGNATIDFEMLMREAEYQGSQHRWALPRVDLIDGKEVPFAQLFVKKHL